MRRDGRGIDYLLGRAAAAAGDDGRRMACKGMRLAITVLISLALAAPATAAPAPPADLFGLFKSICAPGPDPVAGAARAKAQGFAPAKKKPKAGGLDEVDGFEKTIAGREYFVVVGRGKGKPKDGMPASSTIACGVGVKGKDEAGLAAGRRWVGVPVSKSVMGVGFHAFRQGAGGRGALSFDDKPAMKAALAAADLNVLTMFSLGGATMLMLTRSKAES